MSSGITLHMNRRAFRELRWCWCSYERMQSVLKISCRSKEIQRLLHYFERPSGHLMNELSRFCSLVVKLFTTIVKMINNFYRLISLHWLFPLAWKNLFTSECFST